MQVNHFPGSGFVTNKMNLATSEYSFVPRAFQLPKGKEDLIQYVNPNINMCYHLSIVKIRSWTIQLGSSSHILYVPLNICMYHHNVIGYEKPVYNVRSEVKWSSWDQNRENWSFGFKQIRNICPDVRLESNASGRSQVWYWGICRYHKLRAASCLSLWRGCALQVFHASSWSVNVNYKYMYLIIFIPHRFPLQILPSELPSVWPGCARQVRRWWWVPSNMEIKHPQRCVSSRI